MIGARIETTSVGCEPGYQFLLNSKKMFDLCHLVYRFPVDWEEEEGSGMR